MGFVHFTDKDDDFSDEEWEELSKKFKPNKQVDTTESVNNPPEEGKQPTEEKIDNKKAKNLSTFVDVNGFVAPACFDKTYYSNKAYKFEDNTNVSSKWFRIMEYSEKAYDFYRYTMYNFYASLDEFPSNVPEYILACKNKPMNIDFLANQLYEKEKEIFHTFMGRSEFTFNDFIQKHARCIELRQYTAKAWMMYADMKKNNVFRSMLNIENMDLDYSIEENKVKACCVYEKAKYHYDVNWKTMFRDGDALHKTFPITRRLYCPLDNAQLYQEILETIGAYNYHEKTADIKQYKQEIKQEGNIKIVKFYEKYKDILHVMRQLKKIHLSNSIAEPVFWKAFQDSYNPNYNLQSRDLFEVGKKYLYDAAAIYPNVDPNSRTYKDIAYIYNKLNEFLHECKPLHDKWLAAHQTSVDE